MKRIFAMLLLLAAAFACVPAPGVAQTAAPDWREGFRAHDKNRDGRIDRAEFQDWVVDGFYFRDQGRKGYLVQADLQGMISQEVFKSINRTGDGKLSLSEFLNALFQDFAAADADGNGALTLAEIEAYIRQIRQ